MVCMPGAGFGVRGAGAVAAVAGGVVGALWGPAVARAQWTNDSTQNTAVAVASGEQVIPAIATSPVPGSGATVVTWNDSRAGTGYAIYAQRFDAAGNPQWGPNGLLVANTTSSTTTQAHVQMDAADHAVVTFSDNRSGTTQVSIQRISPAGTLLWGPGGAGTTVSSNVIFKTSMRSVSLTDGTYMVAWGEGSVIFLQRIDASGSPIGPTPTTTLTEPPASGGGIRSLLLSDMVASDSASAIILYRRATTSSSLSVTGLSLTKFGPTGAQLWNSGAPIHFYAPISGTTGQSIQNGYLPPLLSDGSGGAIVAWYDTANAVRNAWVQHFTAAGVNRLPLPGVTASTTPATSELRLGAAAAYEPVSDTYTLMYQTSNPAQTQWGVGAQRFDNAGNRLLIPTGVIVQPLGSANQSSFFSARQIGSVATAAVWQVFDGSVIAPQRILAQAIDQSGFTLWNGGSPLVVSDRFGDKSRLVSAAFLGGAGGNGIVTAFGVAGGGLPDLYAQRINADGTLGPPGGGGPTPCGPADIAGTDGSPGADGTVNNGDFQLFFAEFFSANCAGPVPCNAADIAATDGSPGADGSVDNGDFSLFFSAFFSAVCP
jgi:hypothetical protein